MDTWIMWLTMTVLTTLSLNAIQGIRVYEGTNFEEPKTKPNKWAGLAKKSLYISKRSWNSDDQFKEVQNKHDRRSADVDKWKDMIQRKTTEKSFPALYKVSFKGREFVEYIKYTKQVPRLEEYTFCMWYKPNNLTHDHTLFTYALNRNEKLLRFWLSVSDGTLRMAVRENPVYKVPMNVRQGRWHHICQSWHGVLGEWQIFVDGRRIGAGVLPIYKETYIPEGGEIVLSQDLADKRKEYNNGLDGDLFGFNLVDEAVPGEQGSFINSQYKPNFRSSVPPFKKLPPMKKTYQEIKAYISKLPSSPVDLANGIDLKHYPGDQPNALKRTRDSSSQLKRHKPPPRMRHPPVRKVVYYRNDRKLSLDPSLHHHNHHHIPYNVTKIYPTMVSHHGHENATFRPQPTTIRYRVGDDTYSIHSYRMGKDVRRSSNYEIYESLEDDVPAIKRHPETDKEENRRAADRKARENFDLYVARQANKVYTLSNSVRDARKPKFHFERGTVEVPVVAERRKVTKVQVPKVVISQIRGERKHLDSIPVYEPEVLLHREKRKAGVEGDLADGFRRLPQIPDGFIDLFTKNASKTELAQKLNEYFPENSTTAATITAFSKEQEMEEEEEDDDDVGEEAAAANIETASTVSTLKETSAIPTDISPTAMGRNFPPTLYQPLPGDFIPTLPATLNLPVATPASEVKEFDPRHRPEERVSGEYTTADRRKFDVTSGTELIMRSYGLCTTDRGSPIQDKKHLVISWAETPIRIFGGAEIENARNECGNF